MPKNDLKSASIDFRLQINFSELVSFQIWIQQIIRIEHRQIGINTEDGWIDRYKYRGWMDG